ncbi:reverse transcriptase-like protein [Sphingomonas gellani]|uniref:reverse transcriptase-like protein n=1 Tax=Sphingomonas gellani TaxID=1166340 RepID=UPI001FCD504F|nr:reverse transcriptase-like protein [Sphingomonas gellani]
MKVFFDGGYRPDPVGMEWAVVVGGRCHRETGLGPGTSMTAEWLALLGAIRLAQAMGLADPLFLGDAKAVIAQANGTVRCPAPHLRHLEELRAIERQVGRRRIRYVKRTQNLAGIALAMAHERAGRATP